MSNTNVVGLHEARRSKEFLDKLNADAAALPELERAEAERIQEAERSANVERYTQLLEAELPGYHSDVSNITNEIDTLLKSFSEVVKLLLDFQNNNSNIWKLAEQVAYNRIDKSWMTGRPIDSQRSALTREAEQILIDRNIRPLGLIQLKDGSQASRSLANALVELTGIKIQFP